MMGRIKLPTTKLRSLQALLASWDLDSKPSWSSERKHNKVATVNLGAQVNLVSAGHKNALALIQILVNLVDRK